MYFASLKITSPVFVSSMVNTIASLTFVIAVVLRYAVSQSWNYSINFSEHNTTLISESFNLFYFFMLALSMLYIFGLRLEKLDVKSPRGMAKIVGTVVSLSGVTTMTLYKGPVVRNLWGALIHIQGNTVHHESWLKGSILTVASCITWSMWYIMQVFPSRS